MPGMQLPLQVFEDRYVALLRRLIDSEGEELGFGVVAIRHGYEVGERVNELYSGGLPRGARPGRAGDRRASSSCSATARDGSGWTRWTRRPARLWTTGR